MDVERKMISLKVKYESIERTHNTTKQQLRKIKVSSYKKQHLEKNSTKSKMLSQQNLSYHCILLYLLYNLPMEIFPLVPVPCDNYYIFV